MNRGIPDKGYGIRSWMHSDAFSRTPGKFYEFMSGVRLKVNKKIRTRNQSKMDWLLFRAIVAFPRLVCHQDLMAMKQRSGNPLLLVPIKQKPSEMFGEPC